MTTTGDKEVRARWARLLERTAMQRLADDPIVHDADAIASFADDLGHRRAVDGPFLFAMHGVEQTPQSGAALDVALWSGVDAAAVVDPDGTGPLRVMEGPIEVWTETELCAMHALWRTAPARALSCAAWHVEETQPDNATNRPWAIHVFVALGTAEGQAYAEGLLHACRIGGLDRLSALILLDAGRALG